MAKEFILKINGEPAAKSIKGIQEQIKALDEQIKNSDINNPDFDNLVQESNKAKQALGVLQKEGVEGLKPKTAIDGLKGIGESLSSIPGPIGGAIQGFQGLSKAALAFVANPIGAVITALVAIFAAINKAINSTERGTFALNKVFGALGGIIKPITKAIGELAALLAEGLVKAMEAAIKVAQAFGLAFADSAKAGMDLADSINKVEEAEGDLEVARARQNKELAETKALLTDTNASYEDRRKALDKIKAAEISLSQQEVNLANQRLQNAKEKARQDGESAENLDAIDQATIKLLNTEQALAAKRREFNEEEKKLKAEQAAKEKEAADKAKAYAAERQAAQDKIRAAEQKNLLASIKDQEERDKKAAQLDLENSKREIDRGKFTADEKKRLKLEADKTYALQLEKINKDAADKELALQKELADALVNTDEEKFNQLQQRTTENYDKLIEKAKGNAEMQAQLEAQKQELLLQQEKEYNEKLAADKKAAAEKLKAEEEKAYKDRIDAITLTYDKEKALLIQKGLSSAELRKQQDALEIKELEEKLKATEKNNEEFYKLELALYQKKKEIRDREKEEVIEVINASYDLAAGLANGLLELNQMKTDKIMKDERLSEKEREALAKEQFEKQKKLQYALAIIDGAKAITAILSVPDFTLGIASAIRIAAAAASTAFTLAKISRTQFEPTSSGGASSGADTKTAPSMFADGGLVTGPGTGTSDSIDAKLSNGEFVVNAESTRKYFPQLIRMNEEGKRSRIAPFGKDIIGNASDNITAEILKTMDMRLASLEGNKAPIKAYVVSAELTSTQEKDAKISQMARLD